MRFLIFLTVLILSVNLAKADTHFWDGSFSSNYTDAANWTNNTVPDGNDDIVIDGDNLNGGMFNLIINISRTLDDITIRDGGILTIAAGANITSSGGNGVLNMSNGGVLNITGGSIDFSGDATITGSGTSIDISGGTLDVDDLRVYDDTTFDITGGALNADRLELFGTSVSDFSGGTITLDGWLWTDDDAQLNIATTFTGTPGDNDDDDDFWIWGGSSVTVNDGAVISGWTNLDFNDSGAGNADPASLTINGGSFDITGDINADASDDDTITIEGGSLTAGGDFNIDNTNILIDSNGGVIEVNDIIDSNGSNISNFDPPIEGSVISGGAELPINLLSFEAKFSNGQVNISWVTGSEVNNEYIEVQKSFDGKVFKTIARKQGNGTTSDLSNYSYTDTKDLNTSLIYYRLQQFDYDGKSEIFPMKVVSTKSSFLSLTLEVYPNPVTSNVTINYSGFQNKNKVEVAIIDLNGKVVKKNNFDIDTQTYSLSGLDSLNPGVYVLRLVSGNESIQKMLLISQK